MHSSTLSLAVLMVLVGFTAADIPWPSSGELPFPGGPAILNGAWYAPAPTPSQPQISLFVNGQSVGSRFLSDGGLRTTLNTLSSYECLDTQTVRYITNNTFAVNLGNLQNTFACGRRSHQRDSPRHRSYAQDEGKCPDASALDAAMSGFDVTDATGVTRFQVYRRVDGVLPGEPVLECKNSTEPLQVPEPASIEPLATEAPAALSNAGGATVPTRVWKAEGTLAIVSPQGFMESFATPEGMRAIPGRFLTSQCINESSYISASEQLVIFADDTSTRGYRCEKGVVSDETFSLIFSNGPQCSDLITADRPANNTFTLVAPIPGVPLECGAPVMEAPASEP